MIPAVAPPPTVAPSDRAELLRALATFAEPPDHRQPAIAKLLGLDGRPEPGDYAEVFLFAAYPYASVYLGVEGMLGGEARDRVAGFWRALGLVPPAEPDHLAALLGLYAALVDAEEHERANGAVAGAARRRHARAALLWEHLLSWLPPYLGKMAELASPLYAAWAGLLETTMAEEAIAVGPPATLPLHLREAPGLPTDDAAAADWIGALLAPVRSGVIYSRWDLRRGAAALGLGARIGERAFMLRTLLEQDALGTAAWLADEAGRAARAHDDQRATFGPTAERWRDRAQACEAALRSVSFAQQKGSG